MPEKNLPGNKGEVFFLDIPFYRTATGGGASKDGGVFELSPSGGQWKETQLIVFSGLLGIGPTGNVIFDGAGNLYGVAIQGGKAGDGMVFEITP